MIIVAGRIYLQPGKRDRFLEISLVSVEAARATEGCRDFVVAADPLDPHRVNVYEEWDSEAALTRFRGDGPGDDSFSMITSADVKQHVVPEVERPER